MDINQSQRARMEARQEQVMTRRQIQALEMLFSPAQDLESLVREEIEKNPILETGLEEDMPEDFREKDASDDDWLESVLKLDEESRYIRNYRFNLSDEEEERRREYLHSLPVEQTFQESLLEQLRFLDLDPATRACCEAVVSGLDDHGYLKAHPADLAMASGRKLDEVRAAIAIVKELDPPGVAAADVRERLLCQLERSGRRDSPAYVAVRDHLSELANNQLPKVARKMRISVEELKSVMVEIQGLSPRIRPAEIDQSDYVREEVSVVREGDQLTVKLNNEYLPSLRISRQYKRLLDDPDAPKETRDYVKEKIKAGVFLINSLIQRQTTIRKIVEEIVQSQRDYFLTGPDRLKPMTMAAVAERVGVHETTVSRAVSGKHLRCANGLVPLKSFFTGGYETEQGEAVSKNVVVDLVRDLIADEDERAPLSDNEIAARLKDAGYPVARRTVTKYREQIGILPSNIRRKY